MTRHIDAIASKEINQARDEVRDGIEGSTDSLFLRRLSQVNQIASSGRGLLCKREREVVRLLAEGNTNKEIAPLLGIAVRTVETYRSRIMAKLGIHSMAHLVRYAVQNKLVDF